MLYLFIMTTVLYYYYIDVKKINNKLIFYYNKYVQLNEMVSTQYSNKLIILCVCSSIILKSLYLRLWLYLDNTVIRIDKNIYEITYIINGKIYKMIVKPKIGPPNVLLICDEYDNDVTSKICPYIGPNENFHCSEFTPSFFKTKSLTFHISNCGDDIMKFDSNDIIKF